MLTDLSCITSERVQGRVWFSPHCLPVAADDRQASFPGMVGP